jgi:hypothetical protein
MATPGTGEAEIIRMPNRLADRIGPRLKIFTAALLQRAETALEQVRTRFADWLQEDIQALERARDAIRSEGLNEKTIQILAGPARSLRGAGSSFGYPLAGRMAYSLCELLDKTGPKPMVLVDGHIDAIKAVVRDGIRNDTDRRALVTCVALEEEVARLV